MEEIRLQKYLANCGIASRRRCEEYILEGKVKVDGEVVTQLGRKINPEFEKVYFEEKLVIPKDNNFSYILLNKPIGYVTTVKDQFNRKTVLDLVKVNKRIVPVGRLDMFTSGAIILTDDGDFVYKVTHPKNEVNKTYTVTLGGIITDEDVQKLRNGVKLDTGFVTSKAKVKILKIDFEKNISRLEITIHEGKNREIRKMCEAIGKKVMALHRTKIGELDVSDLKIGEWKYLNEKDLEKIL